FDLVCLACSHPRRTLPSLPTRRSSDLVLAYAESESIVRFLIETKGEDATAALLAVFQEGVSYDDAVQRALGVSLDQLDQEWKAWLGYQGDRPGASLTFNNGRAGESPFSELTPIEDITAVALVLLAIVAGAALVVRRRG